MPTYQARILAATVGCLGYNFHADDVCMVVNLSHNLRQMKKTIVLCIKRGQTKQEHSPTRQAPPEETQHHNKNNSKHI
jgi:hypothetical protein